ncbi:MAG: hypothetical protein ACD_30C00092G0037 [uncultured bacterium]|uniref:YcfA family protein n=3 Tax=Candidatus Daviesiibacteriota TaxID=1752718 RepID=A0A0G0HD55_9BACT|nr:MAG: hypothetical protein ACD_30C00092G0037 [uncultured bacterium]KKQ10054.1 MAG: hypothetical protein US19_C0009G0056 [Candidatus Daviesbacteria bacterium GW2011_GWB1_36_5]KKQ15940.1 MAG: hypothetical protein US28_C0007G0031 [Candidatus Daviesbacteria bacterium GW2011_GWA1_36_8]OGE30776.1 MAG: hypothetical protein A3C99_00510 [Candidatus Daviesbacteria bacterium RIFCSPHIGHO2_02_FULL_37_9]OGE34947.1 MAG: hypothetical protein A3E66_00035 [Candidatus Daviesbacteria bacterium RIFCSPHIGHO2_12_FU
MSKTPTNIRPKNLISFLEGLGFVTGKGRGSHIRLINPDGRWTQVAVHPKPIPVGTLKKIISQADLTEEDLKGLK